MKGFLIALQFLTIVPVRIDSEIKAEDFGGSLIYFPLVGLIIGAILLLILLIFNTLPPLAVSAIIILVSVIITGGIHLDGFADTCDALYGFKSRQRALEIMRDSHIGTMGATGIALILLLKFVFIASMETRILWRSLILMPVFARWAQVFSSYIADYAREEGKAKNFIRYIDTKGMLISTAIAIAIFVMTFKIKGLLLFVISFCIILLPIHWIKAKIGGMTGDTIGAVSEIAEAAVLLLSLILKGVPYA